MSEVVSVTNQQAPPGGEEEEQPRLELPPGFRFHPTDEEVVSHYLTPKALDSSFSCVVVADVDLNKIEPWDLPSKAKMGEKEWYFFCHKDRKYPTGMRTNRATNNGYWKATGKDKEIYRGHRVLVGMKKTLVFYTGRAPNGGKTPWVMHEYRLEGKLPPHLPRAAKDAWAVCRVFNKDYLAAKPGQMAPPAASGGLQRIDSLALFDLDDLMVDSAADLPPLMDSPFPDDSLIDDSNGAGGCYQQVKTEQPPLPLQEQNPSGRYQLLPAGDHQAIRRHCKAGAGAAPATTALLNPSSSRGEAAAAAASASAAFSASFPELDDLIVGPPDSYNMMDNYSNMWTTF